MTIDAAGAGVLDVEALDVEALDVEALDVEALDVEASRMNKPAATAANG